MPYPLYYLGSLCARAWLLMLSMCTWSNYWCWCRLLESKQKLFRITFFLASTTYRPPKCYFNIDFASNTPRNMCCLRNCTECSTRSWDFFFLFFSPNKRSRGHYITLNLLLWHSFFLSYIMIYCNIFPFSKENLKIN